MLKRIVIMLIVLIGISIHSWGEGFSHDVFTAVLQDHVRNGLVDYASLQEDPRLDDYLRTVSRFNPEKLTNNDEKMAFYINAYNAYTLKVIVENYPLESITDLNNGGLVSSTVRKKTVWDKKLVTINRKKMTLNDVEHKILRPEFQDFRIHFALVCAALSCPPLRTEAYTGQLLDEQLNDQGRLFLQDTRHNSFDRDRKRAYLTKIVEWFGEDFGKNDKARILSLVPFLDESLGDEILSNAGKWKIIYNEYDWALNDQI